MTSLFEALVPKEMPVDLVTRGGRGVSLLEFLVLDEPAAAEAHDGERLLAENEESERETQMRVMVDTARQQAAAETRAILAAEFDQALRQERAQLAGLLHQFAAERANYFAEAEAEVVRLALGIASQILHREVAADPMHLKQTVRAALSRVSDGSASVLHVQQDRVEAWTSVLHDLGESRVSVVGDRGLRDGDCVLETCIGRVAMGVAPQLGEVELRFRQMLAHDAMGSEQGEAAEVVL